MSKSHKENWKNIKFKNNTIAAQRQGMKIFPNKPETALLNLLNELFPNQYEYTGDGKLIINGKNPDFANINGQKKLIEMFGDYWHRGQDPQDRIDIFKPFGYDTLVIWQSELDDMNKVKDRVMKFHKNIF